LGIDFIGLDEQDTTANAQAFAKKAGTDYPHLFDEKGELLASVKLLPTSGIPSTLVIDRKGRVAARVIGVIHENEFEALLRSLAQE
jgi:peroxiredoxin